MTEQQNQPQPRVRTIYKVIFAPLQELAQTVQTHLDQGWRLQGGPVGHGIHIVQAVVINLTEDQIREHQAKQQEAVAKAAEQQNDEVAKAVDDLASEVGLTDQQRESMWARQDSIDDYFDEEDPEDGWSVEPVEDDGDDLERISLDLDTSRPVSRPAVVLTDQELEMIKIKRERELAAERK